jgi:hypothetical protein
MQLLADISISSGNFGQALIILVAAVIVLGFVWWVIQDYVPGPMKRWAVLVLVLMCVIVLVNFVLSLNGHGFIHW